MKKLFLALAVTAMPVVAAAEEKPDFRAQLATLAGVESMSDEDFDKLATAGKKVYNKCKACHVIGEEKNRVGPHQVAVVGRPAGAVDGFKYSKAMAESGLVWDVQTLNDYLVAPRKYLKGTKMAFAGLKKDADRQAVIAYLIKEGGVYEAPES